MEISRKTDYALRMIARLIEDPDEPVSVRAASRDGAVPYSFARSIQRDLATAGIVTNSRGAAGGMRLAADPRDISLLRLIEALQGPVMVGCCMSSGPEGGVCANVGTCRFATTWCSVELLLSRLLDSVSLYQVVAEGLIPVFEGQFRLVPDAEARKRLKGPAAR